MTNAWTNPEENSAPLPADTKIELPAPGHLVAEIIRASTELMWGLHRQRVAWAKMRQLDEHYKEKGNAFFKDNERPWALAVSDVKWWRGEVSARSNALTAMLALAQATGVRVPRYVESTVAGDIEPQYIKGR